MRKLILICSVILLFGACKKVETAARQNQADAYSGIKNVEEFDEVISEIVVDENGFISARTNKNKIVLSKEAIKEMRNSIQFDKQEIFRGFTKSKLMKSELTLKQQVYFYESILKSNVIIFDSNSKIIISSTTFGDRPQYNNGAGIHYDWNWNYNDCCKPWYDASCITVFGGIHC